MEYFKHRTDVKYVFIMHDERTYTEQIGENAYIEHLEVPKVMGNWEYRYLWKKEKLKPLLTKLNPDIIEVGSPYFMPRMVNALVKENKMKAKVFGFWHADFPVTYVKRFLSKMPFGIANFGEGIAWKYAQKHYNRMAGVLASSQVIIDRMTKNSLENVHFVPLGVDSVLFHPSKKDESLILKMKAGNPERLFMFFPHRFSYEKGVHLLLESYAQLCKLLPIEPVLLFAGTGPSQAAVEEAVVKFEHVHFVGFVKDKEMMAKYMASADLGFALSAWETFGLSLAESLSSGLPLIGANAGASMEHIQKSKAGIILDTLTSEALTDAVVTFSKRKNIEEMKILGRKYAETLTWKACFDKQVKVYQNELGKVT
jgi:alpha-1,6-mannosyltransferase